jgi:hypothetical protein
MMKTPLSLIAFFAISSPAAAQAPVAVPQLLDPATLASYMDDLPHVAYERLNAVMKDPDTLWYDDKVMLPAYQDTVAPDVTVGCRANDFGAQLIVPQGRPTFNAAGDGFAFPFGTTAGADDAKGLEVADFLALPKIEGKIQPVVYYVQKGQRSGFGLVEWRWFYPKGTIFGELLFVRDSEGQRLPVELRTREKFKTGWAMNAYRPFPTAAALAAAIKKARPGFAADAKLADLVAQLGNPASLTAKRLGSAYFKDVFNQDGFLDVLPGHGDAALTRELLTTTPFVTSYETPWKVNGAAKAWAAGTDAPDGIVPQGYTAGVIEVGDQSCARCHKDALRAIEDFAPEAVLYGDIWGSDQIFSFHVMDPAACVGAAQDQRRLRPVFKSSGLVQAYDPKVHGADVYVEFNPKP